MVNIPSGAWSTGSGSGVSAAFCKAVGAGIVVYRLLNVLFDIVVIRIGFSFVVQVYVSVLVECGRCVVVVMQQDSTFCRPLGSLYLNGPLSSAASKKTATQRLKETLDFKNLW